MNSIQYLYLSVNKKLLYYIGQWPHQTIKMKIVISIFFIPTVMAQVVLQGGGFICARNDIDLFMENFAPFLISLMILVKFFNFIYNHDKMRELLIRLEKDGQEFLNSEREIDILIRYYAIGRKLTLGYGACVIGSMLSFMIVPTASIITDKLGFINLTGEKPLIFHVEYFVDTDKYYYLVFVHAYIGTIGLSTVVIAIDAIYIVFIQHACGATEILGYRLGLIGKNGDIESNSGLLRGADRDQKCAAECVVLHNRIIQYAELLQSANAVSFFIQIGINMICISFTLYQMAMKMETPNESFKYASFMTAQTFHLFCQAWPAQQLADHSLRVAEYVFNCRWYLSSFTTRKTLNIILLRSLVPLKLTAGKFFVLNLENFSAVVRTSFSYFTVLCSLQ